MSSPSPPLLSSLVLSLLLLLMTSSSVSSSNSAKIADGFRVDLIHVDSNSNFTAVERLQRAVRRSTHRLARLQARTTMTTTANHDDVLETVVHTGNGEFLMKLSIGTPPLSFSAIVDTGSDLVWTQCQPCIECYKQATPVFNPKKSSSFKKLSCSSDLCQALPTSACDPDCEYIYTYGDYSSSQGVLALETFTLGNTSVHNIGFGCGEDNEGSGFTQGAGLVGLGRGPLSLISQLDLSQFSYCLAPIDSTKTSPLVFGSFTYLYKNESLSFSSTPLMKNPSQPSFYYLSLIGITVGNELLRIPKSNFALKRDGSGGLIIDSGTTITYLQATGYKQLRKTFVSLMKLPVADGSSVGLDLCFDLPSDNSSLEVPKLIFHFEGADLHLPPENYMLGDESSGLLCLAIMGSSGMSILGNFQQQNMQVVYDLEKGVLSFAPAQCDQQ